MIEVVLNDRLGKKIRVKCNEDDTVGDLKKLVAAQTGKHVTGWTGSACSLVCLQVKFYKRDSCMSIAAQPLGARHVCTLLCLACMMLHGACVQQPHCSA
jgi:hypothetical protein